MQARVLIDHRRSYEDPIAFKTGERLVLTGRTDNWNGHTWSWAIAADGREGWIPPQTVSCTDQGVIALRDFSAMELTVSAGETLSVQLCELGWCWCTNATGAAGWVPAEKLQLA